MENFRSDAILMEILSDRKSITGFLDAVFGFLRRNTDFYHIQINNEQIGFAKGVREQILFGAMQRYDPDCIINNLATQDDYDAPPPALQEIEVVTELDTAAVVTELTTMEKKNTLKESQPNFAAADYKNGALCDNYCWSQTLKDVELHIQLPSELQSAKALSIDLKSTSIGVKSRLNPDVIVISGQLSQKVKQNDAVWTIAEGKLLISLDKSKEGWWEKFFNAEKSIDIKKLDCERYIDELPEESQAAIQKLRVQQLQQDEDEQQRDRTTNEGETMLKLQKAWDAEGSPFKGQPFDPSVVKFS